MDVAKSEMFGNFSIFLTSSFEKHKFPTPHLVLLHIQFLGVVLILAFVYC